MNDCIWYIFFNLPGLGHSLSLQLSVSLDNPWHCEPPFWARVCTSLLLFLDPWPHVFEQDVQSDQVPQRQLTISIKFHSDWDCIQWILFCPNSFCYVANECRQISVNIGPLFYFVSERPWTRKIKIGRSDLFISHTFFGQTWL